MRALGGMVALALLCFSAPALPGTTDDSIPDARYVEYGAGFAPYTAQVRVSRADGTVPCGSCVMISDHVALTAAHVLDGYVSGTVVTGSSSHSVASFSRHPQYDEGTFGAHDIALLRVDKSFGLRRYPPLSDGTERPGDTVSIAGYGITGRLSVGHSYFDGKIRAGTSTIRRLDGTLIVCPARAAGTALPICIAPGDSGGPVFSGGKVVGIASHTQKTSDGTPTRSKDGEESCHTRVSLYREWIANMSDEAAE